jgi:hypothetical protein
MEYISLNPTTIVTPDTAKPPGSKATSNYWAEQTKPASILRIRFYHETKAHDRGFQVVYDELIEKTLNSWQEVYGMEAGHSMDRGHCRELGTSHRLRGYSPRTLAMNDNAPRNDTQSDRGVEQGRV